jgi:hypothetical protein
VSREQVHSPLATDDPAQPIMATAEIHWLNGEVDPNTRR